jgi:transposase
MREGAGVFKIDLPKVVANDENDLTVRMRRLLSELFQDLLTAESRVADLTREIEALSHADDRARRLQTIPGLGPMGATALLAAVGNARKFRRARDLAVWLDLALANTLPAVRWSVSAVSAPPFARCSDPGVCAALRGGGLEPG